MAIKLQISGIDQTDHLHYESAISWNLMIGQRGTCTLPLIVGPGDQFSPQVGEAIEIFDPATTRVWAGTIEDVEVSWYGDDGWHLVTVTGISYEALFDTAQVDKLQYTATAAGTIFAALFAASGVTAVSLGTVDAGATIASIQVTRISDAFATLALQSNTVWGVDPATMTLYFRAPDAVSAPWTMGAKDMVWETMKWKQSRSDFRSSQVIQLPDGSSQNSLSNTPNPSLGAQVQRLTLTSAFTSAGAIQEATAALNRYSTLPSQLQVDTDKPGVSVGQMLTISVDHPAEAGAILDGVWQVTEVDARVIPGLDQIDPSSQRMPADLLAGDKIGHFRYTIRLVNSLATTIFQGDGGSTVFALPAGVTVTGIKVIPNDSLYTKYMGIDSVTITPAMPTGSVALVSYHAIMAPAVPSFVSLWNQLSPLASTAGPSGFDSGAGGGGGSDADLFAAELSLKDLTVGNDIAPHAIVYHAGTVTRGLAVLRKVIMTDLTVRILQNGVEIVTTTIPSSTSPNTVLDFAVATGSPAVGAVFADKDVLSADILESDGQTDKNGIATITIEWSSTEA